jgi:hypothetical protein
LVPIYLSSFPFTVGSIHRPTCATAVEADRINRAFVGATIWYNEFQDQDNLSMRVNSFGSGLDWSHSIGFPQFTTNINGGIKGARYRGGTNAAFWVTGIITHPDNPGHDSLILAKWGPTGNLIWGWGWPIYGAGYTGEEIDADRAGNLFVTGIIRSSLETDGHVSQFTTDGGTLVGFDTIGNPSDPPSDDEGWSISLVTPQPNADLILGGATRSAVFYPTPTTCQTTYQGNGDGYIVRYQRPLP